MTVAEGGVRILPVDSKEALRRFIRLPEALYADDPNWIAPLRLERRLHLSARSNPFFRHAEVALWLAERDGKAVGRISAQIDQAALRQYGAPIGLFGFLEAEDHHGTFSALLGTAEAWLKQRDMRLIRGPLNFSMNDELGVLTDGFDTPPVLLMGHGRRYYDSRLAEQGYGKAKDILAYDFSLDQPSLPASARRMVDRLAGDPDIVIRPVRWQDFGREVRSVLEIFNDAWAENWGFLPLGAAEMDKLASDMKPLLRPDFVWIAEVRGEPAAFGVMLPNLNEAIADLGGSLLPFGWAKLIFRLKAGRIRSARLPLMGVRRKLQGTPLGAALAFAIVDRLHSTAAKLGYRKAELSWILEDNMPMRRILETIGAAPYKTYRIYEKTL